MTDNQETHSRDTCCIKGNGAEPRGKRVLWLSISLLIIFSGFASVLLLSRGVSPVHAVAVDSENILVTWENGTVVQHIEWGDFSPGETKNYTVYLKNSDEVSHKIDVNTTGWIPEEAGEYLTLSLHPEDLWINPGTTKKVELFLASANYSNGLRDFRFNTVFYTVETKGISGFNVFFSDNQDARIIYPSSDKFKYLDRAPAQVSDWTASAFVTTKMKSFDEVMDDDFSYIDPSTGCPRGYEGCIVTFGGPVVNVPVYYYERNKIAPLVYCMVPDAHPPGEPWSQWYLANGSTIPESALDPKRGDYDLFIIEIFEDLQGRKVFIAYGTTWKGTYAAGKYFECIVYPNLEQFPNEWIIVKWEDTNNDDFVNNPGDGGDRYTLLTSSSEYENN